MSADNRDREPLPGAPGGEIDDGWGPWRTDISEWDVTTHDVRFECVGGIHKISTRPRADLPPRPAEPAQAAQVDVMVNLYVELENLLAVYSEPDKQLCCDGHMCGCQGATEYQQAEHYAKAALDEARDIIAAAQEGRE